MLNSRFYFISPHFDDVVLSCGGLICALTNLGIKCTIITFFGKTSGIQEPLSPIAIQYVAEDLNIEKEFVDIAKCESYYKSRQLEDIHACSIIGAEYIHLEFLDAIFRKSNLPLYLQEADLFGEIHLQDLCFIKYEIESWFLKKSKLNLWFFPMGNGNHVDHTILTNVGKTLLEQGYKINFYHDFPYPESKDNNFGFSTNRFQVDISTYVNKKKMAILSYQTQLQGLFGFRNFDITFLPNNVNIENYFLLDSALYYLNHLLNRFK